MKTQQWSSIAVAALLGLCAANLVHLPALKTASAQNSDENSADADAGFARAYELSDAFRQVSKRALPAVVSIKTTGKVVKRNVSRRSPFDSDPFLREFFGNQGFGGFSFSEEGFQEREFRSPGGQGSGFIISADGLVMTNAHVVDDSEEVIVQLSDGREFTASDIRKDDRSDVAILRIDAGQKLPFLRFGDDEAMEIGDWVLAFGSPFGLHQTVTQGIISAKARGLGGDANKEFLQTDAAINPGNSGGPLVNLRGEVIGINTAISTRSGGYDGVSLAVPVSLARWVAEQLKSEGSVRRAYIGVQMQTVDAQLASQFGLSAPQGVVVTDVVPDSPADKAGFRQSDVILEIDGRRIQNSRNMLGVVEQLTVGRNYRMRVLRDGRERDLNITPTERPDTAEVPVNEPSTDDELDGTYVLQDTGIAVQNLTKDIADQLGTSAEFGVVITKVQPGSTADRLGLDPGVVIHRVGNQPVNSVTEFMAEIEKSRDAGRALLLASKSSGGQTSSRFVSVPLARRK